MTKTLAGAILAAALAALAYLYFSPYHSCVRALVADKTTPYSEADASLTCARWVR